MRFNLKTMEKKDSNGSGKSMAVENDVFGVKRTETNEETLTLS